MSNKISIVLGSYNRKEFLILTIDSIRAEVNKLNVDTEIIVVDGGSSDGSVEWLIEQKDIISIIQHNRGEWQGKKIERRSWGYFMNLAFEAAKGKYICMMSDDCLIIPDAIKNGYELFEEELKQGNKIGAIAFYFRNWPEQKEYNVGITLGDKMFVNHGMYLKSALEEVNYIDEETYFFYHGDGDLCLKMLQKGYKTIDSPNSYVEHYSHANMEVRNSNNERQKEDWKKYLNKWEGIYYDREKNNFGGWIPKKFHDSTQTYKYFVPLHEEIMKKRFPQPTIPQRILRKLKHLL
jgi:GT2 family glycosyltransferase